MIKLVFMTDTHGRANNPVSRKDDFPQTILNKIEWVVNYANMNNAYILHGGDWIHRPDTSPTWISALAKILIKAEKPVLSVLGNHDIYSYNISTFKRTPLSILEACDCVHFISSDKPYIIQDGEDKIQITGVSAHPLLDRGGRVSDYILTSKQYPAVHIVHGFLANKSWPADVPHTLINDVCENNCADVILTGHEHSGYNIVEKNGIKFCNPGSLARVTASVGDMRDTVQIAEITYDNNTFDIKLVPVTVAKPAEEVLDRKELVEEKSREQFLNVFSEKLISIQQETKLDEEDTRSAADMLNSFIERLKDSEYSDLEGSVTQDVIRMCHALLSEAEEAETASRKQRRAEQ